MLVLQENAELHQFKTRKGKGDVGAADPTRYRGHEGQVEERKL